MMSAIEWTEKTWNPVTGCTVTSPGCKNCYAMKMASRLEAMTAKTGHAAHYVGTTTKVKGKAVWTGKIGIAPDSVWQEPLRRKKPTMYFVNSMGDLFHPNVEDVLIDRAFAVMALSPQHTFQILTKHPERMREYFNEYRWQDIIEELEDNFSGLEFRAQFSNKNELASLHIAARQRKDFPLPNVWLGVSVEDQKHADERIPFLLDTCAAVRFISIEPLLSAVALTGIATSNWLEELQGYEPDGESYTFDALESNDFYSLLGDDGRSVDSVEGELRPKLDWVIVGGESGPNSRPMHPDWARSLRDQCAEADVPFFFKQWGEYFPWGMNWKEGGSMPAHAYVGEKPIEMTDGQLVERIGKTAAGRLLDGALHDAMPRPSAPKSGA